MTRYADPAGLNINKIKYNVKKKKTASWATETRYAGPAGPKVNNINCI